MEQNVKQDKQTPPAAKRGMSGFRKALLWTAVPIVVMSLIGMAGIASNEVNLAVLLGFFWVGAVFYFVGTIIALIICAVMRKRQIVAGILAGLGIGIVSLGVTCFTGNALSGGSWF
jgi:hypothetical protein